MGEPDALTVLLTSPRPIDAHTVGRALEPLYPWLAPFDVRRLCRYCAGVLEEEVSPGRAEDLVRALGAAGAAAIAVPTAAVPAPPPIRRVVRVEVTEAGLELGLGNTVGDGRDRRFEHELRWRDIRAVMLFALEGPTPERPGLRAEDGAIKRYLEDTPLTPDGERLAYTLARLRERDQRDAELGIDVITATHTLRMERSQVVWPSAPSHHSLETYLALGWRVTTGAAHAPQPPENGLMLKGLVDAALFTHPEELRRYERWLLSPAAPKADRTDERGSG